uniref:Uncharacterized protein LOC104243070 n=1 Tax=Nicotiana sylvestris TaxID=4096 RepID=A0A1U7YB69_NICSY|nr:PREDICTED: uncharacterized protein LOC104243070 [Nicotiana sylvestris]
MGELNFFLGLQVMQTPKGTMISQQEHIKELLKRFEMESSKIIDTPIATTTRLEMDEPGFLVNETMHRGIIGSLLYLTTSRSDIVFSVGLSARFQSSPKESHLKVAKRILSCLLLCSIAVDQAATGGLCALNMAKNPVQHRRTKHIDVQYHFLRDNVEKYLICIKFCKTENQVADIFTKALSREHFEKNRLALGLIKSN